MSMFVLISGQKGKGGLLNGFPGNSGPNGHGQNHDGEFPGLGNFPGNGHGNGGEFPGGGKGNGHGNGGGFPGGGNGNGGEFPGGNNGGENGHGNGNGGDNGDDDHGGLPVPVPGPLVNPGVSTGPSLANKLGAFLLLKNLLDQGDDYDYDYRLPRTPRLGQCVTGPVLRTFAGRKLLCDFNGACPTGSSCQNGLCCHLTSGTLVRRRRP